MAFLDYFVGVTQSKYAAVAIFSAIFIICIGILLTNTEISIGNRLIIVFFIMLFSIFPVGLSLFELTCMVTGSKGNKMNACNIFAWFVSIMVIVYCFILIILSLISTFTYKKAISKIETAETYNNISKEDAEIIAKNMMQQNHDSRNDTVHETTMTIPQQQETPDNSLLSAPMDAVNDIPGYDGASANMYSEDLMQYTQQPVSVERFSNKQKKDESEVVTPEPFSDDMHFAQIA
jgi:hypothetical protein